MSSFTFSLADATFREWLYDGLTEHSARQADGTLVADTRAFQADVRDGYFNGLDLSLHQVNFLVTLFKGEKIVFTPSGTLHSPTNQTHSPPSSQINKLVDDFFSACRLSSVSPAGDFVGKTKNYLAERVLDTGTEEERLDQLLRSIRSSEEMKEFKKRVSLDFRSGGKSFDEILFSELSGRERGRALGIVRAKERGKDYYLGKAYGAMGKQFMAIAEMEKKGDWEGGKKLKDQLRENSLQALSEEVSEVDADLLKRKIGEGVLSAHLYVAGHVIKEVERERKQKELHYGMGDDLRGKGTELLRQKQELRALGEAVGQLSGTYNAIVQMVLKGYKPGRGEIEQLNRAMAEAEMELDIYRFSEKEGLSQVEGSYIAAEEGSYTVVGASGALFAGTLVGPMMGAPAAVLAGGINGTLNEMAVRSWGFVIKNETDSGAMKSAFRASATNAFATSVGLGMGMASVGLANPVLRQVVVNEAMGGAHAVLRADETYGIDEMMVMGVSGFVGGKVEATKIGANRLTNLAFEAQREGAENLAEAQFGDEGNVTTEVVVGSAAGALTELGGSKVFMDSAARVREGIREIAQLGNRTLPLNLIELENHFYPFAPPATVKGITMKEDKTRANKAGGGNGDEDYENGVDEAPADDEPGPSLDPDIAALIEESGFELNDERIREIAAEFVSAMKKAGINHQTIKDLLGIILEKGGEYAFDILKVLPDVISTIRESDLIGQYISFLNKLSPYNVFYLLRNFTLLEDQATEKGFPPEDFYLWLMDAIHLLPEDGIVAIIDLMIYGDAEVKEAGGGYENENYEADVDDHSAEGDSGSSGRIELIRGIIAKDLVFEANPTEADWVTRRYAAGTLGEMLSSSVNDAEKTLIVTALIERLRDQDSTMRKIVGTALLNNFSQLSPTLRECVVKQMVDVMFDHDYLWKISLDFLKKRGPMLSYEDQQLFAEEIWSCIREGRLLGNLPNHVISIFTLFKTLHAGYLATSLNHSDGETRRKMLVALDNDSDLPPSIRLFFLSALCAYYNASLKDGKIFYLEFLQAVARLGQNIPKKERDKIVSPQLNALLKFSGVRPDLPQQGVKPSGAEPLLNNIGGGRGEEEAVEDYEMEPEASPHSDR